MPEAPGRPKLDQPRAKRTFMLRLDDPAENHANQQIEAMIKKGRFQTWIRDLVVNATADSAHPKSSALVEERYADPEDSA